jgi:hypothetical protein
MTVEEAPIEPWVERSRQCVLYLGFAWPVASALLSLFSGPDYLVWGLIGVTFMAFMFTPVAVILSIVVPTMKARLFGVPILLFVFINWTSNGSNVNYPTGLPSVLWIVTFTAITMLMPEVGSVRRFYSRIFLKR